VGGDWLGSSVVLGHRRRAYRLNTNGADWCEGIAPPAEKEEKTNVVELKVTKKSRRKTA